LNEVGINCLRAFPRRGIRVWGARTLRRGSTWRYINVRRVMMTAARWINRNMADVACEPHTPRLWDSITRDLTAYFGDLARRGALVGPPNAEAFYVKCDAETNPPEEREVGRVVTEIGLRPAAPSEFIIIRIIHGPAGVEIVEP
jgi:phage tail sheath protein FI